MTTKTTTNSFVNSCLLCVGFCILFLTAILCVNFLLPSEGKSDKDELPIIVEAPFESTDDEETPVFVNYLKEASDVSLSKTEDSGLKLYRDPTSRSAVEWFYLHVTGNSDVALAILSEAEKNDIPLSLAFSLAYVESRYNTHAVNSNTNSSIDRGLFQLNSGSFPNLSEEDFYNPAISAKYGMSHLKFCLNTAGNSVSALAMYNAGTNKVRSNRTPQSTLNYIGKIMNYQETIEKLFEEEVVSYFSAPFSSMYSLAMVK